MRSFSCLVSLFDVKGVVSSLGLVHKTAVAVAGGNLAVVADIDKSLQSLLQRIVGIYQQFAVVDHQGIEIVAWLEAAHFPEEASARLGGHPEDLRQGEEPTAIVAFIVHLAHLSGIHHHAEDAEVVTSAHVTTQTYGDACFEESAYRCYARANVQI